MRTTIQQLAEKFGVTRDAAYGFVRFCVEKKVLTKAGTTHVPGTKGKGADIYEWDVDAFGRLIVDSLAALGEAAKQLESTETKS